MQKARRHTAKGAPTACRRMVSGTISLPCSGCFSPFPHGTGTLSVSREYLALPDGPGGFTQGYSCPALLRMPLPITCLRVRDCHPLRPNFPDRSASHVSRTNAVLQPRTCLDTTGLGSSPFARHYWGNHCYFLFLQVLRCFSSLRSPPRTQKSGDSLKEAGLSHSETRGSGAVCASPRIFAAYHVLHRLREPRHPPCALHYFIALWTVHAPQDTQPKKERKGSQGAQARSCDANPPPTRREERRSRFLCFLLLSHHVIDRGGEYGPDSAGTKETPRGGEYRNRTDDLLHAMQAL